MKPARRLAVNSAWSCMGPSKVAARLTKDESQAASSGPLADHAQGEEMRFMKLFSGLLIGGRETVSMGRALLWLFVGIAVYFWFCRPVEAFPSSLEFALGSALAYNLGGKAVKQLGSASRGDDD